MRLSVHLGHKYQNLFDLDHAATHHAILVAFFLDCYSLFREKTIMAAEMSPDSIISVLLMIAGKAIREPWILVVMGLAMIGFFFRATASKRRSHNRG